MTKKYVEVDLTPKHETTWAEDEKDAPDLVGTLEFLRDELYEGEPGVSSSERPPNNQLLGRKDTAAYIQGMEKGTIK